MKLNRSQKRLIADLLANFESQTVEKVLFRFDEETRSEVCQMMGKAVEGRWKHSGGSLVDFAKFLNYDPQDVTRQGGQRQAASRIPENRHQNTTLIPDVTLKSIWALDDESLDILLRSSPPDLTIDALCCSPKYFLHRVLSRLSEAEATQVAKEISQTGTIDVDRVAEIQRRYCQFASSLLASGQIRIPEIKQASSLYGHGTK